MGHALFFAMALASIVNFFMPVSMAIDAGCDYYQDLLMGREYYIYNKEYPNYYGRSTSCKWTARSQAGTRIVVACEDISMPKTTNCYGDRLAISLSGSATFSDSKNFCGIGSVTLVSTGNALTVGLFSTASSTGGRFTCTITAIIDSNGSTTEKPNVCDCGWKQNTRIVGGQATGINEYPSMVGLIDLQKRELYCGGSIISDRYILSAAHCVYNWQVGNIAILVGDHNISSGVDTARAALYTVAAFEIHPSYNPSTQINDISILQTTKAIALSLYVGPVCLPFRYTTNDFNGQVVTALGWGQLEFSGPKSDTLQEVNLRVTSNTECAAQNTESPITPGQICTFASGKDACQSDSGGPILWTDTSTHRLQLIGIISYGLGCATYRPGINTRVTYYLSWIISRTSDASYCIK